MDKPGFVYLISCQDDGGEPYLKIGCSTTPLRRIGAVLGGCPIEPREIAFCEVFSHGGNKKQSAEHLAKAVEQHLHRLLAAKRARREWFRIDIKCPEDKAQFQAAWKLAIVEFNLSPSPWKVIGMNEFRKKRAAFKPKRRTKLEIARQLAQGLSHLRP